MELYKAQDPKFDNIQYNKDAKKSWKELVVEFTQNTTFHGFRYITLPTPYFLRRLIWFGIVMGVSAGFGYIVYHRAQKYLMFQKNVNVEIDVNQNMSFPAVTICNQNSLRLSKIFDERLYNIISEYFTDNDEGVFVKDKCQKYFGEVQRTVASVKDNNESFDHFASLPVDTCRRLCSGLTNSSLGCIGFVYNKDTYNCTLIKTAFDSPNDHFIPRDAVHLTYSSADTYFHKIRCDEFQHESVSLIGSGLQLKVSDMTFWEDHHMIRNYSGLMKDAAHQSGDLIHSCKWKGKPCGQSNFTQQLTDFGTCYTFNAVQTDDPKFTITRTGSSFGLSLTINVEDFENMPGPHSVAGVKVFLHSPDEIPMVTDLGFAIPSGSYSLVGIFASEVNNEKPPIGDCGRKTLKYFPKGEYSWFRCYRDCEIAKFLTECQCIAPYMELPFNDGDELDTICNATHYFKCSAKTHGNHRALENETECRSTCLSPCTRVVYDPQISNAALSSFSIEHILRNDVEQLQKKYIHALDIKHRVQEDAFADAVAYLFAADEAYTLFIKATEAKVSHFQTSTINPVVEALRQVIEIFDKDMNEVVFSGLDDAMEQIDLVFGPNKDTIERFVSLVVENCKFVSLHVNNLVQYDYKYPELNELLDDTIQYTKVVVESLPRYYNMVTNVSLTMKRLGFEYDSFDFAPQRLAVQSENCSNGVINFAKETAEVRNRLDKIQDKLSFWISSDEDSDVKPILKGLYLQLYDYEAYFEQLRNDCFSQFLNAVKEVKDFKQFYKENINVLLDMEFTFEFEEEIADIRTEYETFKTIINNYVRRHETTKSDLQNSLTAEELDEDISEVNGFISKVKFRLTERLRNRVDEARDEITDWYQSMVRRAGAMREFMAPNFMEERVGRMDIWNVPVVEMFDNDTDDVENTLIFNASEWTLQSFISDKGYAHMENILLKTVDPINERLDSYEEELDNLGQDLTTALTQVRNLMTSYRIQDRMDERYVLKNFLQMDIYYPELKTRKVIQLEAYGIEDLFGDIGGYMGLFLGASTVTVLEVLDLIFYNLMLKFLSGNERRSTTGNNKNTAGVF